MKRELITAYFLMAVAGAWALGQDEGTPDGTPSPSPTSSPETSPTASPSPSPEPASIAEQLNSAVVLNEIHHVNVSEIQSAQSAQGRLQRPDVQQFAQTLITDHQANEIRVQEVASSEGVTLLGFQQSTFEVAGENLLNNLSASEFDQGFLELQRLSHQRAIRDLQSMQSSITDAQVQSLVSDTITMMQQHLEQATSLLSSAGAQPSPTTSPSPAASPSPEAGDMTTG